MVCQTIKTGLECSFMSKSGCGYIGGSCQKIVSTMRRLRKSPGVLGRKVLHGLPQPFRKVVDWRMPPGDAHESRQGRIHAEAQPHQGIQAILKEITPVSRRCRTRPVEWTKKSRSGRVPLFGPAFCCLICVQLRRSRMAFSSCLIDRSISRHSSSPPGTAGLSFRSSWSRFFAPAMVNLS